MLCRNVKRGRNTFDSDDAVTPLFRSLGAAQAYSLPSKAWLNLTSTSHTLYCCNWNGPARNSSLLRDLDKGSVNSSAGR